MLAIRCCDQFTTLDLGLIHVAKVRPVNPNLILDAMEHMAANGLELDQYVFNTAISAYAACDPPRVQDAMQLMRQMANAGVPPHTHTHTRKKSEEKKEKNRVTAQCAFPLPACRFAACCALVSDRD